MKGEILNFSIQTNSGVITGADGQRYSFDGSNWRESVPPTRGVAVDFQTQGSAALEIYRALGSGTSAGSGEKNKTTAGLLAILLGAFGVHKFYLGDTTAGAITLAISLGAGLVTCGAATFIMSVIGIIEGIIYLSKSDADFQQTYVLGKKSWF
jgi:TM2 domain-containing membrane protein YozV